MQSGFFLYDLCTKDNFQIENTVVKTNKENFNMRTNAILLSALVLCTAIIISCSKSSTGTTTGGGGSTTVDCSTAAKSFAADVSPIVSTKCAISGCHDAGSTNGPGPLITYGQISAAKSTIRAAVSSGQMPKTGSLTTAQKNSITCWVDAGGLNN